MYHKANPFVLSFDKLKILAELTKKYYPKFELKTLIQNLEIPTYFATMGASNCINIEGYLPKDREKMITWIDTVIEAVDEKELRRYRENLQHL